MRALLAIALSVSIAGCTNSPVKVDTSFGSFVTNASPAQERLLADDATRQLLLLYPPANTRLEFRQDIADGFGRQLVELLRVQGYALHELKLPVGTLPTADAPTSAASVSDATKNIPLNYVLDAVTSPKLYRVTLILGSQTLTRAYVPQNETVHPAGAWVRKE